MSGAYGSGTFSAASPGAFMSRKRARGSYSTSSRPFGGTIHPVVRNSLSNARIGGLLGIELKFKDNQGARVMVQGGVTEYVLGTASDDSAIAVITQGQGAGQRDGRRINVRSILIKGNVQLLGLAQVVTPAMPGGNLVRIDLMLDTQANGTEPVLANIFEPAADIAQLPHTPHQLEWTRRYRSLDHVTVAVNPESVVIDTGPATPETFSGTMQSPEFVLQWKGNKEVNYTGTGGDPSNLTDYNFFLIARCAENVAIAPLQINWSSRCRFMG